ncbi:MAG: DUF3516 domain-containing protein [Actinomycetota bacterium]|nr:DUF3516 domain-containing protein [Actinomycetota bacterium]
MDTSAPDSATATADAPGEAPLPPLLRHLPSSVGADADELLDAFLAYCMDKGIELYPAQEEAILELFGGSNVILATPTGSGKSLVALAGHFAAYVRGGRSVYTAPIKALVSEKFFELCRDLGSDHVGMLTGDAAVNPDAPVICCTAEVLANWALRDGEKTPVDHVVMDEFHFYSDRSRGVAWQVPLLQLPRAQFLLMSATLGNTARFEEELTERTGRRTVLVASAERPVPLDFTYRETPLHESISEIVELGRTPAYVVHFTQKSATEAAQSMTSIDVLSKDEKAAVKDAIGGFRFDTAFGKDLRRYVTQGVGVHHAGMLPKYRLLVEKLAQDGLLKLICGTDTLGVGINVPIRTVLFTQLCKFDGERVRVLGVRDFQQIAGRAGRKGYDDAGSVWVQAPPHVVENKRIDEKAAADPKKRKKLVKKKPPEKNYAHWSDDTLRKLIEGRPEELVSSFEVNHMMLLHLLDRPGDGAAAVKRLLLDNHESRADQRRHIRRAIAIFRSLVEAGIVERLDEPDEDGRTVRVNLDLQEDFRLNQPLSPFVLEVVESLDLTDDTDSGERDERGRTDPQQRALDVLSVVEAVLENPWVVLYAQQDRAKGELLAKLKSEGVEYEERMERLAEVRWPQPLADELWERFRPFRTANPWVGDDAIKPKSVARDLFERSATFNEYVASYGLKRSEGVLLRYLSDTYKAMVQTIPESWKSEEILDLTEWLGELVRQVDSSLLDEWERLRDPDRLLDEADEPLRPPERSDITANTRAFSVMVRNELFRWVGLLARRAHRELAEVPAASDDERWTPEAIAELMAPYWDEHDSIGTGADARAHVMQILPAENERGRDWDAVQLIDDPEGHHEWRLVGRVDLDASRAEGRAVVRLVTIAKL